MIIIGSIDTREEAFEIQYISKVDIVSQRFQNLEGVHNE